MMEILAIKIPNYYNCKLIMLSKLLDKETKEDINQTLGSVLFPLKCYILILLLILVIMCYFLYEIYLKSKVI